MRQLIDNQLGLTGNAIAGTYVVFFGLDLAPPQRPGFRGFGFKRYDHKEDESIWLRGLKTFEKTEPHPATGETFSTRYHPVQSFQWCDYSVKPGRDYTYTIVALYGDPANLEARFEVEVPVTTEVETGPVHSAFFNRGSTATQEYARRFQNEPPNKAGPGAYEWLSRGLLEALITFIDRAQDGWSIHGAVYEFQWPAVLDAIKRAHKRGVTVRVLFDDIEAYSKDKKTGKKKPSGPWKKNEEAVAKAGIKSLCKGRKNGKLMHNKFFVLSQDGQPKAVWTGSTNLTSNGIFGHSNLVHIVEDEQVARDFLDYWHRLEKDLPVGDEYRSANVAVSPAPPIPWTNATTAVFSPRKTDLDSLGWYAELAGSAQQGLFMTFAFGMHEKFKEIYRRNDTVLRMALLESDGSKAKDKRDIQVIRNRPNVVLAVGNRIATNSFDRWLAERTSYGVHVYWIHTKYMLIDLLSASPIVASGSANFSKASTDTNDENMLVIRGDRRIADIYFGEFLRLHTHYAFREAVKWYMNRKKKTAESWKPQYLIEEDSWMNSYFDPADRSGRNARRAYFAGPMAC